MPVPSQGHYGFHSFPVVYWFCLFIYLWVLTIPLEDCSDFGNFVITLIYWHNMFLCISYCMHWYRNMWLGGSSTIYECIIIAFEHVHVVEILPLGRFQETIWFRKWIYFLRYGTQSLQKWLPLFWMLNQMQNSPSIWLTWEFFSCVCVENFSALHVHGRHFAASPNEQHYFCCRWTVKLSNSIHNL
jgi:hypothetical protein